MILDEIKALLDTLDVPHETGVFSDKAPEQHIVIVPLTDTFALHADNLPNADIEEARLVVYPQTNYTALVNNLVAALLLNYFTVTDRHYIGFDSSTGYFQYVVDAEKCYS